MGYFSNYSGKKPEINCRRQTGNLHIIITCENKEHTLKQPEGQKRSQRRYIRTMKTKKQ
jgi:hypothetical protein